MDNRGNSRANTCKKPDERRAVFIGYETDGSDALVIHNNFTDRMALSRRRVNQISALSTFDGTVEAYHGDNG